MRSGGDGRRILGDLERELLVEIVETESDE